MDLSVLGQASKKRPVCSWGTASSAVFSMASTGTVICLAARSARARVSSGDHCESQPVNVETRAMPAGLVLASSGTAHEGHAGLAVVRFDGRIQEPGVGQRPVGDDHAVGLLVPRDRTWSSSSPRVQRPAPDARGLLGAEVREVLGRVRRPVWVARVVEVQFDVAHVGVGLVEDGGVDEVAEHLGSAQVRGVVDERVTGDELAQVDGVAGRRVGDGGMLGLRLVEGGQRTPTGPADQDHRRVAPHLLRVADEGAVVDAAPSP